MATTGEKLKRLRRAKTLTQAELAEKSGVAQSTIVSVERGTRKEPRPHTIRKLSQALGVEPIELLED